MKKALSIVIPILLLFACNSAKLDEIRTFIPGIYVRFSNHEMRTQYDTIKIEVLSERGNNYRLLKSSYFQKKLDGKIFPWEYKAEELTAVYDEKFKVLRESDNQKITSFIPEKQAMLVGATEYKKIK